MLPTFQFIAPVMLDLVGETIHPSELELLKHPLTGGVILFKRNYRHLAQLQELTAAIKKINPHLYIAVDHEGGRVQRFQEGFTTIPPMRTLGTLFDTDETSALEKAFEYGSTIAKELQQAGVDFTFAPVLDLDYGTSTVIGDRAFHSDPEIVTRLVSAFIDGLHHHHMPAVGKHFPGHGFVHADSHTDLPVDHRSFEEIEAKDLVPFQKLSSKLAGVMPAHVLYPTVDADLAGFSEFWVQKILIEQYQFKGTIFSDDLTMAAAHPFGNIVDRAKKALQAGCHVVLVCNRPEEAHKLLEGLG